MLNKKNGEIISRPETEITTETKRKENYETMGIPVDRLLLCHGLPMTD